MMLPSPRRLFVLACAATAIGVPAASAAGAEAVSEQAPLAWAQRLVDETNPEETDYRHKDTTVTWKGSSGARATISRTDCSGLVNAVLQRSYGWGPEQFRRWLGRARPVASSYHDAIDTERGFRRIAAVGEIQPGDLIAIRYPDGSPNSGHIMVVAGAPQAHVASAPAVAGTAQWTVEVIDSSQSGHGNADNRYLGNHRFRAGIGHGRLRLYADGAGRITGYSWSTQANSEYYTPDQRHLVVGRLVVPAVRDLKP